MRRAALFLLGAVAGVLAVEAALRLVVTEAVAAEHYFSRGVTEADPDSLVRLRPLARGFVQRFGQARIPLFTDEYGCRSGPAARTGDASRTILVAATSQAFGLSLRNEDTLPARLEEDLCEGNPHAVRVVNASLPGHKLVDYPSVLDRLVPWVRPDCAVVGVYLHEGLENEAVRTDARVEVVDGLLLEADRSMRGAAVDWIRTESWLGMRVFARVREIERGRLGPGGRYFRRLTYGELARSMEEGARRLRDAARRHAIPVVVVLFPHYDFDRPPLRSVHAMVRNGLHDFGLPTLDLGLDTPEGRSFTRADVTAFDLHLNAQGSRKAARILARFLRDQGLAP